MEPLDSPEFTPEQKRNAQQNARDIERTLLRLIRIFGRKEMRDKLIKEFGASKTNNEFNNFNEQFVELKKLWTFKLTTPLEEVNSVLEQLTKLKNTTSQLKTKLNQHEESFNKFQESAKEQKEQRQRDLEELQTLSINKKTKKQTDEDKLNEQGAEIRKQREDEHLRRKAELLKKIDDMKTQLDAKVNLNKLEEQGLTTAFESADLNYTQALDSYDAELNTQSEELKMANKELEDKVYELTQLK